MKIAALGVIVNFFFLQKLGPEIFGHTQSGRFVVTISYTSSELWFSVKQHALWLFRDFVFVERSWHIHSNAGT